MARCLICARIEPCFFRRRSSEDSRASGFVRGSTLLDIWRRSVVLATALRKRPLPRRRP